MSDLIASLQFEILGSLRLFRNDEACTPSAPMQRTLLSLLLINRNEFVSTARIIDELWGRRPPNSAPAAVQMYVSAIRRILLPNSSVPAGGFDRHPVLRTRPSGYVLHVDAGQLDVTRFRELAARGRAELARGQCARAKELFGTALRMWRGAALADVRRTEALQQYAERLDEERRTLLMERLWLDLRHRRDHLIVGELTDLCAQYPLREAFQHQLMLALALSGRRVEALDVYTRTYRTMVEEVGIEPGSRLRAAQEVLLREDSPAAIWSHVLTESSFATGDCACGAREEAVPRHQETTVDSPVRSSRTSRRIRAVQPRPWST